MITYVYNRTDNSNSKCITVCTLKKNILCVWVIGRYKLLEYYEI